MIFQARLLTNLIRKLKCIGVGDPFVELTVFPSKIKYVKDISKLLLGETAGFKAWFSQAQAQAQSRKKDKF